MIAVDIGIGGSGCCTAPRPATRLLLSTLVAGGAGIAHAGDAESAGDVQERRC